LKKQNDGGEKIIANIKPGEELNQREKTTMLRIIIVMAIRKYKYDPKAQRNEATQRIAADSESINLSVSADTVLKYLREGAEQLNPE